ncbi:sodium-dependent phosphate transport protein 1 isoform X2 [Odocoileus virginianus]|uniref:Sodium-dependent phosphate transport protein 1 isoform X2 n=1 Tax=Odocoileus virginianus TaxID=9874 RepID=A0ABM4H9V5_ODOVR
MQVDNQVSPGKVPHFCSIRYGIAVFLLLCNVIIMSQRVCMSLTMIAMVNNTEPHGLSNTSTKELQDNIKNPVYNWSTEMQGIMLSSIFYAELGEIWVIICRVIKGLFQGITLTTQQVIWIKWAPPLELTRLTSLSLSGLLLGPCIVLLITGFICDSLGWPMVFYIFGACGCALSVLWFILFYEDPKDHPYISIREKEYITSALTQQVSSSTPIKVPIKALLKSVPLWVISICNFAFFWSNTFLSIYMPTYIDYKLQVGVKENGLLSSLPPLFAWIFAVLAGYMADIFQTRNTFSLITIRKLFTSLGLLLPSIFSLCLLYLSSDFYGTIIFLILANSTSSFAMGGLVINLVDIAPRYYGFLRGLTNIIGLTGGLISSTVTGTILSEDAESPWVKIFLLMIGNNMIGLIFYLIFAKAEVQDWAKERQNTYL